MRSHGSPLLSVHATLWPLAATRHVSAVASSLISSSVKLCFASSRPVSAQDTWTAVAPMPTARHVLGAVAGNDGRIHAIDGNNPYNSALWIVETYAPSTSTWSTRLTDLLHLFVSPERQGSGHAVLVANTAVHATTERFATRCTNFQRSCNRWEQIHAFS